MSAAEPARSTLDELRCLACGYLLRGLHPSGACPECGRAIWDSLNDRGLLSLPRAQLARITRGLALVEAALWSPIVYLAILVLVLYVDQNSPFLDVWTHGAVVFLIAVALSGFAGLILLTTPPPRELASEFVWNARRATRVSACTVAAAATIAMSARLGSGTLWVHILCWWSIALALASLGVLGAAFSRWLHVAMRKPFPDPWSGVNVLSSIALAVMIPFVVFPFAVSRLTGASPPFFMPCVTVLAVATGLANYGLTLMLMRRLQLRLATS